MNSHKKYLFLLLTLVLLTSCEKRDESSLPLSSSGNRQEINSTETTDTPLIKEETPPLPEVPTPQVSPIEKVSSPEIKDSEKKDELIKDTPKNTLPEKKNEINTEKKKEESSSVSPKVVRLTQTYNSPGGQDQVAFSINLEGNKIASVKTEIIETHDVSKKYIAGFSAGINDTIIGKTLEEAKNISTISGASLTTGAFKKALKNM